MSKIPTAPFYGSKVVEIKDLTKVFAFINETALFKGQWQYKQGRKSPEEYQKILEETVYPKFAEIKAQSNPRKIARSKIGLRLFPVPVGRQRSDHLQDDERTERMRFTFPRQPFEQRGGKNLVSGGFLRLKRFGQN